MYDHPFQWGSKRTGPDLARVGGKYSDDWHRDHLNSPRSVVSGTVMPGYPWLAATELDFEHIASDLKIQATLGVPYTAEMVAQAQADVRTQATRARPRRPISPSAIRRRSRATTTAILPASLKPTP